MLGALLASYFEAQWQAMDPSGRASFALLRADGLPLIERPAAGQAHPDPAAYQAMPQAGD